MKRSICFFFFYLFPILGISQNLLPNPSFEDVNICQKYQEPCSPKAWRSTLLKGFVYGEFNGEINQKYLSTKDNVVIIPPDGTRYVSLRMYNKVKESDRTFIQVPLLCKLEAGKTYEIKFQLYTPVYMLQEFGVAFVDTLKIFKYNEFVMNLTPQVKFTFEERITRKKWMTVSQQYIATGEEEAIILGNFNTDDQTVVTSLVNHKKDRVPNRVYFVFDDFSLHPVDSTSISNCDVDKHLQFLYQDTTRHIPRPKIKRASDYPVDTLALPSLEDTLATTSIEIPTPPLSEEKEEIISIEKDFVFKDITFETNKAILKSSAYHPLEELASFLLVNPNYRLQITGHTDNEGTLRFNQLLSQRRALTVANFLIEKGIHLSRLHTNGKGELKPIAENTTAEGRELNRRVTFRVIVR